MNPKTLIRVKDLHFKYQSGYHALRGVNLTASSREVIGLIGQNGAGKTTLVKHFNGLLKPSSGTVEILGDNIQDKPVSHMAKYVGYVFQNPEDQLFCSSVWAEVAFGPKNLGFPKEELDETVKEALKRVDLLDVRDEHPYDLIYGDRKLLSIASVLAMKPRILILDEPDTGQDLKGLSLLMRIINDFSKKEGLVVLISHNLDLVAQCSDRLLVLYRGKILGDVQTSRGLPDSQMLSKAELEPPQLVRLSVKLKRFNVPQDLITVNALGNYLLSLKS